MIYFIQAGDGGPVKIGYATDVAARVRELQCGNHVRLRLLRSIEGGRAAEAWFHRAYAAQRMRGEWFAFAESMLTAEPEIVVAFEAKIRSDLIARLGGCSAVAALLKVSAANVSNWHKRGIPHRYRYTLAVAADEKGIPLPSGFFDDGMTDAEALAFIRRQRGAA